MTKNSHRTTWSREEDTSQKKIGMLALRKEKVVSKPTQQMSTIVIALCANSFHVLSRGFLAYRTWISAILQYAVKTLLVWAFKIPESHLRGSDIGGKRLHLLFHKLDNRNRNNSLTKKLFPHQS